MGRKKLNKSLIQQVKETLDAKLAIGKSKLAAKIDGTYTHFIYSWETYRSYLKHACYFVRWCKEQEIDQALGHKPRTLAECRIFTERWIQYGIDRGLSAYTIKLELSALAKLYGCTTKDFNVKTPPRQRRNIKRSRGNAARDKNFSVANNINMIIFCKCTGLRRAELAQIRGTDLIELDGQLCMKIHRATKGGRPRVSPIVGSAEELEIVKKLCADAGEGKIFPHPNENADIHSFRATYARRVYELHKREFNEFRKERLIVYKNNIVDSYINKNGRRDYGKYPHLYINIEGKLKKQPGYRDISSSFFCRGDLKGKVYDRRALFEASRALGHNREDVVAEHYLY